jgi:uncharacterized protein with ParB-like and HNH nuclease domain
MIFLNRNYMGEKTIETYRYLKDLFDDKEIKKISVPSYQRAYSWEQKQLDQFIGDLNEMTFKDKKGYYFGHFIFENEDELFNVIDGQQRLTTFILFLIACQNQQESTAQDAIISKFFTVDYDQISFNLLKKNLSIEQSNEQKTLSISRIEFALAYFKNQFEIGNLNIDKIEQYISVLKDAHISTHITEDKAVAVQIFELHNSRGVKLNTIEKVKAKLMKTLYLSASNKDVVKLINSVQKSFGEIYHLEEKTKGAAFNRNLGLDEILLIHLRMIDDGSKIINPERKQVYNSPSKTGNREENILNYIDEKINSLEKEQLVKYIDALVQKFKESVKFITEELVDLDLNNPIIGDAILLDRNHSLSFFMLIKHKELIHKLFNSNDVVLVWEKLLFTKDFHGNFYRLKWTENFEDLFFKVANLNQNGTIIEIVNDYKDHGFRSDYLNNDLQKVVKEYVQNNKNKIIQFAFNWHREKMIYLLYKYEINLQSDCRKDLREIIKNGVSVEHILPQEWDLNWTKFEDNTSDEVRLFHDKIDKVINGIGNLLLLSSSENSSQSNSHPKHKFYSVNGKSYKDHNSNNQIWEDSNKWEENIKSRGEDICQFLINYIENK